MSKLRSLPWLAKLGLGSLPVLAFVALLGLGGPPAPEIDAIGFQDDASEPCLGDADPSYNCSGDEGGGGGSTANCYICRITTNSLTGAKSATCKQSDAGKGSKCTAIIDNGDVSCKIENPAGC